MGKAERNRQQNARQRIAMQQAAAQRAESRRKMLIVGGSAIVVVVVVVALIVVRSLSGSGTAKAAKSAGSATNATIAAKITSVPSTVLDQVGAGPTGSAAVAPLKSISGPALTLNGKPEMLYIGAEFCPFCAAERWAMVAALSRFGTFSNLHFIHSTPNDIYSNTSTLSFYKSSYTSKYLSFLPLETETITEQPLQKMTQAQSALLTKYTQGSFPFVDVGGKYIVDGAQFQPSVLGTPQQQNPSHFGLTWQQIAADMQNSNSPVGQEIIAAANHITAAICQVTKGQPGNVCQSKSVTSVNGSI
jgi:thiol-disulfide isomerase/thioredoxin